MAAFLLSVCLAGLGRTLLQHLWSPTALYVVVGESVIGQGSHGLSLKCGSLGPARSATFHCCFQLAVAYLNLTIQVIQMEKEHFHGEKLD